jgi:putative transcriptional regulator
LAVAALVLGPAILGSVPPKIDGTPQSTSLAGRLLVASERIGDPNFIHSVVLMVRHDKDGAFGITINRPVAERSLKNLLELFGETDASAEGTAQVLAGGPVQPAAAFVVHTVDYTRSQTLSVDEHIGVTSSVEIVRDIAHGKGPQKALIAFGYAGWGSGQLEAEIERDDWFTGPANLNLIFDVSREHVWGEALSRRFRDL